MGDTLEDRLTALETTVTRVQRLVDRLMRVFPNVVYPLINNDATDDQIAAVINYLDACAADVAAGRGPTPTEFSARIYELLPHRVDHDKLPGLIASWSYFPPDTRPLYVHLRDAGLEHIERGVERPET